MIATLDRHHPQQSKQPGKQQSANGRAGRSANDWPAGDLEPHPLAEIFPRLSEAGLQDLAEEMRARGAAAPFLKRGGILLDSIDRFEACKLAGLSPILREWDGSGSLAELIARSHLPTVHLSESQRAAIAVPISDWLAEDKLRNRAANLNRGQQQNTKTAFSAKFPDGALLHHRGMSNSCDDAGGENEGESDGEEAAAEAGRATEIAARLCGVSRRYVCEARRLREQDGGLFEAVRRGELNLSRARVAASKRLRAEAIAAAGTPGGKKSKEPDGRLILGDCLDVITGELGATRGRVKLCFADPPYNMGQKYDSDPTGDRRPDSDYLAFCRAWMHACRDLLAPDGTLFVMIDGHYQGRFDAMLREECGLHHRNTIVWRDPFPTHTDRAFQPSARFIHYFTKESRGFTWNPDAVRVPSRRDQIGDARRVSNKGIVPHDVWEFPRVVGNSRQRVPFADCPPQVPAEIVERCILAASNPGDLVFDPFTGNGTTWKAARKLGRDFLGIERSPLYAAQARLWAHS